MASAMKHVATLVLSMESLRFLLLLVIDQALMCACPTFYDEREGCVIAGGNKFYEKKRSAICHSPVSQPLAASLHLKTLKRCNSRTVSVSLIRTAIRPPERT